MPKFHTCNKRMKRCAVLKSPFLLDISSSLTHLVTSSIIFKFSSLSLLFKTSEVTQSCLTLCDPMDCSLPGSSVHGIFQARVLEWGAPHLSLSSLHIIASVTGLIQYSYHFSQDRIDVNLGLKTLGHTLLPSLFPVLFLSSGVETGRSDRGGRILHDVPSIESSWLFSTTIQVHCRQAK